MTMPNFKLSYGASFAAALALLVSAGAAAQDDTTDAVEPATEATPVVEEIIVKGYRGSLLRALDRKKIADEFVDAVSAEDIGQLAAENIGDAIFGLPGVDIDFDNGEAESILVGGLGAEYNQVTMGGVSIGSINDGGWGPVEGSQGVGGFATSMIAGVDVIKSPSASQTEGALGGVINLRPWKPLNFREPRLKLSGTLGYQDKTGENDGKLNVLYGMRNDNRSFGFVIGGASERREFRNDQFTSASTNIYRFDGASSTARGPAEELALAPRAVNFRQNHLLYERNNLFGALQFRPRDNLDFSIGGSYARFERDRNQTLAGGRFAQNVWYDEDMLVRLPASYAEDERVNERVLGGVWLADPALSTVGEGSFLRWQSYHFIQENETKIVDFELNWSPTEKTDVKFKASYSHNENGQKAGDGGHMTFDQRANMVWGLDNGQGLPFYALLNPDVAVITRKNNGKIKTASWNDELYPNFDPADPATWSDALDESAARDPSQFWSNGATPGNKYNEASGQAISLDMTYRMKGDFIKSIKYGARLANSEFTFQNTSGLSPPNAWFRGKYFLSDVGTQGVVDSNFFSGDGEPWDIPDWDAALAALYGGAGEWLGTNIDGPQSFFRLDQIHDGETDTFAAYIQANFRTNRWMGNFGVRYVSDDYWSVAPRIIPGIGIATTPWQRLDADGEIYTGNKNNQTYGANWDHAAADALMDPANFEDRTGGIVETHVLPSFNARVELTDDMFLRFAAAKAMARQPFNQRRATTWFRPANDGDEDETNDTYILSGGNPQMKATIANSVNVAFEWYFSDASLFSIAYLYKDLKNVRSVLRKELIGEDFVHPVTGELFENIDIEERRADGNGYGTLYNVEFSLIQSLGYLPGRFFDNMGYSLNYTYSERDVVRPVDNGVQSLPGPPPHSINAQLFYQNDRFMVRLAHNWREGRISRVSINPGNTTDVWQAARENTTLTAQYAINSNFDIGLRVQNLFDIRSLSYGAGYEDLPSNMSEVGLRYLLSLNYTF